MIALAAQATPSPDQQRLNAISLDLDAMRQNVDRIATTQEHITRNVEQLTAGQDRMTREITKLQAVEQQILHKNSEPPPRPAPASACSGYPSDRGMLRRIGYMFTLPGPCPVGLVSRRAFFRARR